jgi:hypothetical protein
MALADYFEGRTPFRLPERWIDVTRDAGGPTRRTLSELLYQLTRARATERLDAVVCNAQFLRARCEAHSVFDLLSDLDTALDVSSRAMEAVRDALRDAIPSLQEFPHLAVQDLFNRLRWLPQTGVSAIPAVAAWRHELDATIPWLSAELPLPVSGLSEGLSINLATGPIAAWVASSGKNIAVLDASGTFRERSTSTGAVVSQVQLRPGLRTAGRAGGTGIVVWQDADGEVGTEHRTAPVPAGRGRPFVTTGQFGAVYVSGGGDLVSWLPGAPCCTVLYPSLPPPCGLLRETPGDGHVLFAAGQTLQLVGIIETDRPEAPARTVTFSGPPIVDADYDAARGSYVLLTQDRRLRLVDATTGSGQADLPYEQAGRGITGAAAGCAFGAGVFASWVFAVTTDGVLFGWSPASKEVRKIREIWSKEAPSTLLALRVDQTNGRLIAVTRNQIWIGRPDSEIVDPLRHQSSVTAVLIDPSGILVSAAAQTNSVRWHAPDGANEKAAHWVPQPSALLRWTGARDVVVGTSRGTVWRQSPERESSADERFDLFSAPVAALVQGRGPDHAVAAASTGKILDLSFATEHAQLVDVGIGTRKFLCLASRRQDGAYIGISYDETMLDPLESLVAHLRPSYSTARLRSLRGTVVRIYTADAPARVIGIDPSYRQRAAISVDADWLCLAGSTLAVFQIGHERVTPVAERSLVAQHIAFIATTPPHLVVVVDDSWLEVVDLTPDLRSLARCRVPSPISSLATAGSRIACGLRDGRVVSLRFHPFLAQPGAGVDNAFLWTKD